MDQILYNRPKRSVLSMDNHVIFMTYRYKSYTVVPLLVATLNRGHPL